MTTSLSSLLGASPTAGTLPVTYGGTGSSTLVLNGVLLGNGTSAVQSVAPGTSGNVLTSNGATWSSQPAPISLHSQTGNVCKVLTTNGTTASWSVSPAILPVLKRNGTTSNVTFLSGYLAVVNRSGTTIQVSIT